MKILQDPGISNTYPPGQYKPYDDGVRDGVFILNATGGLLVGAVSFFAFLLICNLKL